MAYSTSLQQPILNDSSIGVTRGSGMRRLAGQIEGAKVSEGHSTRNIGAQIPQHALTMQKLCEDGLHELYAEKEGGQDQQDPPALRGNIYVYFFFLFKLDARGSARSAAKPARLCQIFYLIQQGAGD